MKYKRLIYGFAFAFSFIFSLIYLFVFNVYIPNHEKNETITLYMNQIGLYKEVENAQKIQTSLKAEEIDTYIYKNKDLYVVISGLGDEDDAKANGTMLKNLSYSHILKMVEISDPEIISCVKTQDFEKALELMEYQSQGDGE